MIGGSAGGISALSVIFDSLPQDLPAAVVVILHQTKDSVYKLAGALARTSHHPIVVVEKDEPLRQGTIYIPAPGMSLSFGQGRIVEAESDRPHQALTTISRMFAAAAREYHDRVIGVVLSGLLRDGTDGLRAIHEAGGLTVVQDPAEAEFAEMPSNASRNLPVTFSLPIVDLGPALELLCRRTTALETGVAVSVRLLKSRVELLVRLKDQSGKNPDVGRFLDEELVLLRRDLRSINRLLDDAEA